MRFLFLMNNLGNGGAERVLVNLANELSQDPEYDVTIRCLIKSGPQLERLSDRVKCEAIFKQQLLPRGLNYLYLLPHRFIYNKVIGKGDYDVIIPYLHGVLTRIVGYAPEQQKTIAYLHANMEKSPFIRQLGSQRKIRALFEKYNAIVAVSEDVKNSFVNVSGLAASKINVIYNTFDVKEIRRLAEEPVYSIGASNGTGCHICSVGKLDQVKGYERLIRIAGMLKKQGILFNLSIVGDGNQKENLLNQIAENDLQDCITLEGYQKNPYKYISNSDLFVCSSYTEGFSSVVAESLILGVPVITTDCPGMKEMLGDNEYGVITENSEDALYEGMKRLLSDPDLLAHYRKKARERSAFFSPEQTVTAVEQLLEKVIHE